MDYSLEIIKNETTVNQSLWVNNLVKIQFQSIISMPSYIFLRLIIISQIY